jgi:hypothetical protein
MPRLSRHGRLIAGLAAWIGCVSLASALAVVMAYPGIGANDVERKTVAKVSLPRRETLDLLRIDAALGDADASGQLTRRLLDRYEQTGDGNDLNEAMQWILCDWDRPQQPRSSAMPCVTEEHCNGPALRRHWLCNEGE